MNSNQSNRRIRILHIALSMEHGGLERIINHFARKLDRDLFEVSICCLDGGGEFLDDLSEFGIKSKVLARRPGFMDFRVLWALARYISNERIDIVHSHSGCSLYASVAAHLGGAKGVIHTDHGRLVPDRLSLVLEDKVSSKFMNAYIAVSEQLAGYLSNNVGISAKKLRVIINGVDTVRFIPLVESLVKKARRNLERSADSIL
jgi:glycosyltransferase involved in cell wall biosynthesis